MMPTLGIWSLQYSPWIEANAWNCLCRLRVQACGITGHITGKLAESTKRELSIVVAVADLAVVTAGVSAFQTGEKLRHISTPSEVTFVSFQRAIDGPNSIRRIRNRRKTAEKSSRATTFRPLARPKPRDACRVYALAAFRQIPTYPPFPALSMDVTLISMGRCQKQQTQAHVLQFLTSD